MNSSIDIDRNLNKYYDLCEEYDILKWKCDDLQEKLEETEALINEYRNERNQAITDRDAFIENIKANLRVRGLNFEVLDDNTKLSEQQLQEMGNPTEDGRIAESN